MRKKLMSSKGINYYVCYSVEGSSRHMVKDPDCPGRYFQAELIEQKVIDKLMQVSLDPMEIRQAASEEIIESEKPVNLDRKIKSATKELEDIKKRIKRWHSAFELESIEIDEMRERTNELKERRMVLENELISLQSIHDAQIAATINMDELIAEMKHFRKNWELADHEERRILLSTVIDKVLVDRNGEVKIAF